MKLLKPTNEYSEQIMEYREAFLHADEQPHGSSSLQNFDSLDEWFEKVSKQELGENLQGNRVPSSQFLSVEQGELIGFVNIRKRLNQELLRESGHIGYSIHPNKRRQGYATKQLKLALDEAQKLGLQKVLITCDKANIASAKTIQKVGGVLENEVVSSHTGEIIQRYWVEI
ncbi:MULTISPECIES: GNAT family N-acetyltransferase [Bacillus]|uniref:GNAT family acetyltransferase n=2 Tax=Bacillus cereus group TaxID=86661 RepID=A0A2A7D1I0_BACAN|nr:MULTISPECIES: GNAT family N-acetyltransferase [Bacillus]MCP1163129.1 GNAT family N-acetyltransferase [Bacillus sp. 1813sda1]OTW65148.1 GNAT family N-acetyltransferase [Bacillus thuringiensis serovar coreanensis]OTX42810.1 GNAT family N-acetyltransferase [Bacillus thuringiensis serovar sooncheon]OTX56404.1 GNAT family N-acetyltransferase [Bacillus thuringiensis serovar guiyangiensis]OTX73167.1 GNAT family N-acetyltransferase [Bacillus thuringiensis serovar roskildiensis]